MSRIRTAIALTAALFVGCEQADPPQPTPIARPSPWSYVALGDSLATGAGIRSYVAGYAEQLREDPGVEVSVVNLGVDGWTSADLLTALRTDDQMRDAISSADVVTWDIGGNDLLRARFAYRAGLCNGTTCLQEAELGFRTNWLEILEELTALRRPQEAIMRTMDLYNPYVAQDTDPAGTLEVLQPFLERTNELIHTTSEAAGIRVAPVHDAFNGPDGDRDPVPLGLISSDGLHPTLEGHRLIAQEFAALGTEPLVPAP